MYNSLLLDERTTLNFKQDKKFKLTLKNWIKEWGIITATERTKEIKMKCTDCKSQNAVNCQGDIFLCRKCDKRRFGKLTGIHEYTTTKKELFNTITEYNPAYQNKTTVKEVKTKEIEQLNKNSEKSEATQDSTNKEQRESKQVQQHQNVTIEHRRLLL